DEVEGSGLGLSLVKKTVDSLGGKIQLESVGRGCCFRFSWPMHIVNKEGI
ncbi:MAG: ATP-binding protein, partial [Shewanella sp.]